MKTLQITSSVIEVSANHYSKTGWYAFHEVKGILPGCRKEKKLTLTPHYGAVSVASLYDHNGHAYIEIEQWRELVKAAPVVPARTSPMQLDDAIIALAQEQAESICNVARDMGEKHTNYSPKFSPLVVGQVPAK
jgi:hypothetical protein